ncbi:MAG: TonB-dependent receptor [Gemmatimonadales bacterium]
MSLQPIRRACLGFAVGAFSFLAPHRSQAQVVIPPATEIPIPPKPRTDSAKADSTKADSAKIKRDTIQPPLGRGFSPRTADIGPQYSWNREELFASGAYSLADLLERVPGATSFRTGWLASPKFVAVNGDLTRVAVFYDGIAMDNLDPRNGSMLDLTTIALWTLENVSIERFANELRVHLRSWRVERTDPYTRTDIYTGDEDTNIYRGYYGKRFGNGAGLQLGGEQFSTRSNRFGGGGDGLSFIGRAGIARRMWSVDAFAVRRNGSRALQPTFGTGLSLPPYDGTHTLAYMRAGWGNPAGGPWLQAIVSSMRFAEKSQHFTPDIAPSRLVRSDTSDTTRKRVQYVLTAGLARGVLRASVLDRIRAFDGAVHHAPSARVEVGTELGIVDLFVEHDGRIKRRRVDGVFRLTPRPYVSVAGAGSLDSPDDGSPGVGADPGGVPFTRPRTFSARLEAGVRVWNPWLIAGFVSRDTALLEPPALIDSAYTFKYVGRRKGLYAGLRGKLYRDINADIVTTLWDSAGFYQPRYQARSEVNLTTRWLSRFPSGSFGLKLAAIYEYRSRVAFPLADGVRTSTTSSVGSALVEIRILRGVASYQVRNIFGEINQIVPDFYMPRSISVYGIRWEFWN